MAHKNLQTSKKTGRQTGRVKDIQHRTQSTHYSVTDVFAGLDTASVLKGTVPYIWKSAIVFPVPKVIVYTARSFVVVITVCCYFTDCSAVISTDRPSISAASIDRQKEQLYKFCRIF